MRPRTMPARQAHRGFTLIEVIMVMVLLSVISAGVARFMLPATDAFINSKARAELVDQANTAARRMIQDIQRAVPNSIRSPQTTCFELVPAASGGRYRMEADTLNDPASPTCPDASNSNCSAPLVSTDTTVAFDSLTALTPLPSRDDWVVINNQNGNDVYTSGVNKAQIDTVSAFSATRDQGAHRITLQTTQQLAQGYDGGRFLVVPNDQKAVYYVCSGAGSSGSEGTGTLYRLKNYGFFQNGYSGSNAAGSCPNISGDVAVVATHIKLCKFLYNPSQGATQQSGYVAMDIEVMRNNETVHLSTGAHVSNVP